MCWPSSSSRRLTAGTTSAPTKKSSATRPSRTRPAPVRMPGGAGTQSLRNAVAMRTQCKRIAKAMLSRHQTPVTKQKSKKQERGVRRTAHVSPTDGRRLPRTSISLLPNAPRSTGARRRRSSVTTGTASLAPRAARRTGTARGGTGSGVPTRRAVLVLGRGTSSRSGKRRRA